MLVYNLANKKKSIGILVIFFAVIINGCQRNDKKYLYYNSSNTYYVQLEKSNHKGMSDTLCMFYDYSKPSLIKQVGFLKNGFRNGLWDYYHNGDVKMIKWAHYKDGTLGFETNLFSKADSTKFGPFFTKFDFLTEDGKVSLVVTINGPFKDSLPDANYERITRAELKEIGVTEIKYIRLKADHIPPNIHIYRLSGKLNNDVKFLKGCYGFIDKNHFVEFSVSSNSFNNFYGNILFDAVFTDLYVGGKRFYNPLVFENK